MNKTLNYIRRVRFPVVLLAIIGVVRELLAPYVRFDLPDFVERHAAIIFVVLGLAGLSLLFFDSARQDAGAVNKDAAPKERSHRIDLYQIFSFLVNTLVGFFATSVICAIYIAIKSSIFEWSSDVNEIALVWLIIFVGWIFAPTKIV